MKKMLVAAVTSAAIVLTPAVAQAWTVLEERTGYRVAYADAWTRDYRKVRFYAGHPDSGITGTFHFTWRVRCRGGSLRPRPGSRTTHPGTT